MDFFANIIINKVIYIQNIFDLDILLEQLYLLIAFWSRVSGSLEIKNEKETKKMLQLARAVVIPIGLTQPD